ncbi:MAG TPA: alpha/beta hydrolase [Dermatophilaceae bacterium]|nr:alpha/beta hydrolase [Dermatophilaceae bacterium]
MRRLARDIVNGTVEEVAGLPVMVLGTGRPVVYLPGLSFTHEPPSGVVRAWELATLRRLSRQVEIHWVGRRRAAPDGYAISDFAHDCAEALGVRFGGPIPVVCFSTGGFVGLRLAVDHPDLVERLVVAGAGHQLSEAGRESNRRWIEALTEHRPRDAWRELAADVVRSDRALSAVGAVLAAIAPLITPDDCSDGIRTAIAETSLDLGPSLSRIGAPTLLVAGDRDASCTPVILAETQSGIPDAQLVLLPGVTHLGALTSRAAARAIASFLAE